MAGTKIQWTEETWNPIAGCSVVSPGCTNCYAMRRTAPRLSKNPATPHYAGTVQPSKGGYVWTGKIGIAGDTAYLKPLRTKKPTLFFVNSMSDLFHENVPDEVIDRIFAIMALCPQHTFQVLTKRSARMREYMNGHQSHIPYLGRMPLERIHIEAAGHMDGDGGLMDKLKERGNIYSLYLSSPWPLPNVWLGVSVEDQTRAAERIPDLLATPAAIRFVSAEPLLGPVNLTNLGGGCWSETWDAMKGEHWVAGAGSINSSTHKCPRLDWVIVGGESGKGARPMHPDWARSIRDQCAAADVPHFFKQWGECIGGDTEDLGDRVWFNSQGKNDSRYLKESDQFGWFEPDTAPDGAAWLKVGTKAAGRLLDGVEHNAMPEAR